MPLIPLHNEEEGIIITMHCLEGHGDHLLPNNLEFCKTLKEHENDYDYEESMHTTFGLVPAGRSPGTYRLGEVMSAGAIPVIIARDFVRPFPEDVDWASFSFMFSPDEVSTTMLSTLRAVPEEKLVQMQVRSLPRLARHSPLYDPFRSDFYLSVALSEENVNTSWGIPSPGWVSKLSACSILSSPQFNIFAFDSQVFRYWRVQYPDSAHVFSAVNGVRAT